MAKRKAARALRQRSGKTGRKSSARRKTATRSRAAVKKVAVKKAGVKKAADTLIGGQPLTWVIVGDLSRVEADVRALGLGEVKVFDAEGRVLH